MSLLNSRSLMGVAVAFGTTIVVSTSSNAHADNN